MCSPLNGALTPFPAPLPHLSPQMEAGREPLHRGESCYHQPLELAPGPHLGLGVPHPTTDGHLQTDPRQQGQSVAPVQRGPNCRTRFLIFKSNSCRLQGSVELGGVAPIAVSAGGAEVKAEPGNTQVSRAGVRTVDFDRMKDRSPAVRRVVFIWRASI